MVTVSIVSCSRGLIILGSQTAILWLHCKTQVIMAIAVLLVPTSSNIAHVQSVVTVHNIQSLLIVPSHVQYMYMLYMCAS